MITSLATLMILLSIGMYWKRLHQKTENERFKYNLFALRDELRRLALDGSVDRESRIFDYYDKTISTTIYQSYELTFPRLLLLSFIHNNSDEAKSQRVHEEIEMETEQFPELVNIRRKLVTHLTVYMAGQHYVTFRILSPVVTLILGAKVVNNKFKHVINSIFYMPETSASGQYMVPA